MMFKGWRRERCVEEEDEICGQYITRPGVAVASTVT